MKMDLLTALHFLKLGDIPPAWVDEVWESEFTEIKLPPEEIQEELDSSTDEDFKKLYQCLLPFTVGHRPSPGKDETPQSIWVLLGENGMSVKTLVAVLSSFVLAGKTKRASAVQRVNSLSAASIYLLLLAIPGGIINQVFHEVLLDTCSGMVSHCWPEDSTKKRKKEGVKSSQAEGKRSKPHRKDDQEMDVDEEEDEGEADVHISGQDLVKLRDAVLLLVQSLLILLENLSFKDKKQCLTTVTQVFVKLTYFEPVTGGVSFAAVQDISELKSIPEMAFYGLRLLCSPKHGDQKEALRRVFHRLLFVILMMSKANRMKPTVLVRSQTVLAARDQAIQFICHIVNEFRELALPFLQILLQHICVHMVEKSEYRTFGAQTVGTLTSPMASTEYACFVKWLYNFSRTSKMVGRLFSVDVVMTLLEQPERNPDDCQDFELVRFLSHKFLIQELLFARRMDASPTVQGHALSCLAQCLELPSLNATRAVQNLFSATTNQTELGEVTEGSLSSQQSQKTFATLPFKTVEISSAENLSGEGKENIAHLLRRVSDSKANVRKSALQALMGLLKHNVIPMSWESVVLLSDRCRDPSVSVKKKALQCVGELLAAKPNCSVLQKAWLQGVLPAVVDSESSVQEKALEALEQVLLRPVKPFSPGCHLDSQQRLTWDLLMMLCHELRSLSRYFSRAFTIWSQQNKFTPAFITCLLSHTEAIHSAGAWLLLSKVVASSPNLPCSKILDAWDDMVSSKDMNKRTSCHILSVMGDIAPHLNDDTKGRITDDLMSLLKSFTMPLEVISAAVETLFLIGRCEDVKQTQAFLNQHCGELVSLCESALSKILLNENGTQNLDEELMVKHLHTLGVVSLHCPAHIGKRTVLLVESVLTTQADKETDYMENLPPSLPLSQFKANSLPPSVRAHGVVTLGKLCLQHEHLAHKYLPVFARELEVGTEVAVRNNVVVVMCDLCVRYTNIVDHYIPNISACLRDKEEVIRKQTLIMLTNLLQEDFVKCKGSLFFRFMVALVDPVPEIARLCEYCLVQLLLKRNPEIFSQHFIECIFHFNSYDKHKSYNKFPQSEKGKAQFSLKGAQHREKRFRIYRFLLERFTDAQRFNITMKINQTVLACFADEELPIDQDGAAILAETFSVLSLKEMKLQSISAPAGGSAADEPEDGNIAKAVMQVAQKKVVSQVQKKAFIENTVPLVISLKSLLEQKRSPVLGHLMAYLQVMTQDYRSEVKEFFAGDEQLAAELEFKLQMAEKEREMEAQMNLCNLASGTKSRTASLPCSPALPRSVLSLKFATPQPPSHKLPGRLSLSDRRVPSNSEEQRKLAPLERTSAINYRAISTPKGVNLSLTFDEGPSAILDHATSLSGEPSVLHMNAQEQQAPAVRQWNVESPLRKKKSATRR